MNYPLGSFPRFGHQERWAGERRNRAMLNSILTRQSDAEDHLRKEIAFHDVLSQIVNSMHSTVTEGQQTIDEFKWRLESIRRRHESGKRVYYKKLIEILLSVSEATGTSPELKEFSYEELRLIIQNLAEKHLRGESVISQNKSPGQP